MKKPPRGGSCGIVLGVMARWLLLFCVSLAACGDGGPPSADGSPPTPPPPCCASTALISGEFGAQEQFFLDSYDDLRDNTKGVRAGNGTYFSGAHLEDARDTAIFVASRWAEEAFAIVDDYAQAGELDGPAITNLVEDRRDSMLAYVLADYDEFTSHPNWAGSAAAVSQIRQEIIGGMNAEFDALHVALQDAGYT